MSLNEQNGIEEGAQDNVAHERNPQEQAFTTILAAETIAGHINTVKDLGAFRKVNRTCYDASLSNWRKKVILCLGNGGKATATVRQFMEKVYNKELVDSYHVSHCSLPPENLSDDQWRSYADFKFWKECGPLIKTLHLEGCEFDQRRLINLVCNLVPKLEFLSITSFDSRQPKLLNETWNTSDFAPNINLRTFLVHGRLWFPNWGFMESFPNLVEFKLTSEADNNLFSTLHNLRKVNNFSILNLKTLNINHVDHSWDGLDEANLQLEHLRLFIGNDATPDRFETLLRSQSETLKTLTLHQCPDPCWYPLLFPSQLNLSVLKELHFWGRVVNNLNFLKWTPSLKVLVMDFMCLNMNTEHYGSCFTAVKDTERIKFNDMILDSKVLRETKNFQHLNMEHFQTDYAFSCGGLKFLGKWMPNLKVLKTVLEDAELEVVCGQWTKLVTLQLLFDSEITDEGLTGLPRSPATDKEQVRKPNITDLKELRKFGVDCYSKDSLLTDASVHNGFLQMPQLKALTLYCSSSLSKNAEALLKEKIPNAEVYRNYADGQFRCYEQNNHKTAAKFYFNLCFLKIVRKTNSQ